MVTFAWLLRSFWPVIRSLTGRSCDMILRLSAPNPDMMTPQQSTVVEQSMRAV